MTSWQPGPSSFITKPPDWISYHKEPRVLEENRDICNIQLSTIHWVLFIFLLNILLSHKKGIIHHGRNKFAFFNISYSEKLKCLKFSFQCGCQIPLLCQIPYRLPCLILVLLWQRERGQNHEPKRDLHTLVSRKEYHSLKERNWEGGQPNQIIAISVFIRRIRIGQILFAVFFFFNWALLFIIAPLEDIFYF